MQKLLIIINPRSGIMRGQKMLLSIVDEFCKSGNLVSVHTTQKRADATEFAYKYANDFDVIVAIGGDGTLNEVITGAVRANFKGKFGFIPCGTTNDLANSLGLPKIPEKAAHLIATGEAKSIDIASFGNDRIFTYVASFGAFTETSYNTDQKAKNAIGHLAYIADGINSLSQIKPHRMKIKVDGAEYEDEFIFGAVANAKTVGGLMKLEGADVDFCDGKHEVLLVKNPNSPIKFAQLFTNIINGIFDDQSVILLHGSKIVCSSPEKVDWSVDGEYAGSCKEIEINNLHNRISVFRP